MDHQAALIFAALALATSGCDQSLPPHGEVLVIVDTDLPTPAIASRFRADFYTTDGVWYATGNVPVPDEAAWPLSFGVWSDDDVNDKLVLVRLRIYPDGRERDYHGEHYEPPAIETLDAQTREVVGPPEPRLQSADSDAGDQTPATEPLPKVTVDRLVLLRVQPNVVRRAVVTLRGVCAGTMAKLASESFRGPSLDEARTCVDTEGAIVPIDEYPTDTSTGAVVTSEVGTFGAGSPCTHEPADPKYACIPSGAFVFGGPRLEGVNVESSTPDRIVRVSTFAMDVNEVSVGQYRDALAHGLPMPFELVPDSFESLNGKACPYTAQPTKDDGVGMACLYWSSARAYCIFRGGDLPSEVQWEWAATGGRTFKPRFPWGDDPPDCANFDFGRAFGDGFGYGPFDSTCGTVGPFALKNTPKDVSQFGIARMGGGLEEWTLDFGKPFTAPCWKIAPSIDPVCDSFADKSGQHVLRGGSWRSAAGELDTLARFFESNSADDFAGFRCVYSTPPGGWK